MNACYKIISKAYKQSNLQKNIHDQGEKKRLPYHTGIKTHQQKGKSTGKSMEKQALPQAGGGRINYN